MQANIGHYSFDLSKPIDLSLPLIPGAEGPKCFGAPDFQVDPVRAGDFVGSTEEGGPLNFLNLHINPHGNGTHTECVGHLAGSPYTINRALKRFLFQAELISVKPEARGEDQVISLQAVQEKLGRGRAEALVLRTLPNDVLKSNRDWTGSNPPYLEAELCAWLAEEGFQHLLLDLPSVDREVDGGALAAHKAWWNYPGDEVRDEATITEMIYVPDEVEDGTYLLQFQIAPLEVDASPSKPILYPRMEKHRMAD